MATKKVFMDNGGNFTSKGLIKGQVYEIGDRKESQSKPGSFMCTVMGPGLSAPINMWETTIEKEFSSITAQQPVQQQIPISPVQTPTQQVPQTQQSAQQGAPKPGVQDILLALDKLQIGIERQIKNITIPAAIAPSNKEVKDILLSELLKLDFNFLNIKLIKVENKVSMTLIMDGTEPLSITSKDLSAHSVVEAITGAFSEQSMVIRSIGDFRKRTAELLATKEQEAKAAASAPKPKLDTPLASSVPEGPSTVKSRKAAAEKAAAEKAAAERVTAGMQAPIEDDPEPDEPIMEADFTEERNNGGLTQETQDFHLV
jgi:hypothetical protein